MQFDAKAEMPSVEFDRCIDILGYVTYADLATVGPFSPSPDKTSFHKEFMGEFMGSQEPSSGYELPPFAWGSYKTAPTLSSAKHALRACLVSDRVGRGEDKSAPPTRTNSTLRVVFTGLLPQFSKRFYQRELSEIGSPRTPERQEGLTLTRTKQALRHPSRLLRWKHDPRQLRWHVLRSFPVATRR